MNMISAADYFSDKLSPVPSLNSSIAKLLITRSPKHAWMQHPRLNPNYKPEVKEDFQSVGLPEPEGRRSGDRLDEQGDS
jgi:hypothetical protein